MSKILIVADIMYNYLFNESEKWTMPLDFYKPTLGGTLFNTARAAATSFESVVSLGCVGDNDKNLIEFEFNKNKLINNIFFTNNNSTGICIILNDSSGERKGMISYRSANCYLDFSQINLNDINDIDYLFINGWSFFPQSRTSKSCLLLMDFAREIGAKVIFDMLPHHVNRTTITDEYKEAITKTNILISEVNTFKTFFDFEEENISTNSVMYPLIQNIDYFLIFNYVHKLAVFNKTKFSEEILTGYEFNKNTEYLLDRIALSAISKLIPKNDSN